ncbi:hypothetical protein ACEPAI_1896 [Sanghuangporus weigelae]
MLTDHAWSHLTYVVPKLEHLELAGDDELVHLLNTTPLIRRLDLGEACEITDAILAALAPRNNLEDEQGKIQNPETDSRFEILNLFYAVQLTNDAILSLTNCTRLIHLELDSTRVKDFVLSALRKVRKISGYHSKSGRMLASAGWTSTKAVSAGRGRRGKKRDEPKQQTN